MRQGLSVVSWSSGTVEAGEDAIGSRLQEGLAQGEGVWKTFIRGLNRGREGAWPFHQEVWRMGSFVQITKT